MKANILIYILNFFELLACGTGFYYWNKLKNSYWKWFPVYLAVIFLVEMTGKYFRIGLGNVEWNTALYIYFGIPIQFLFFFWLFGKQAQNKKEWLLIVFLTTIYILCWLIELFYIRNTKFWFSSFSYTAGNLLLVILIINFLLKFINSNDILHYKQSMMFWIVTGLALFYLNTLPFFALRNTLATNHRNVFAIYQNLQLILGCLMYFTFSLAFIWGKPK